MNKNLIKIKPKEKPKYYIEKYQITKGTYSRWVTYGVSCNTLIRYNLYDLIDTNNFPEWYRKIRAIEESNEW